MTTAQATYEVTMPGTGMIARVKSPEEVRMFQDSRDKYIEEYQLTKLNDLVVLGALLWQQILMARAQAALSGFREERDNSGVPTGNWVEMDHEEVAAASALLQKATDQVKGLEKQLGIDKATRESGGAYNLADYIRTLKKAAHERGVHISKRVLLIERLFNELSWRIRALKTWDTEDLAHYDLTPENLIEWCDQEINAIKEADKEFAKEVFGKVFVGKL